MADSKGGMLHVSKGVARGHILCCCAVTFVCFMLTCLNLYMLSSTRAVLRHLDDKLDAHLRSLQQQQLQIPSPEATSAALLMQQQLQALQDLQPDGADDFILLAPSDLDNAWTTQTGRLLVPVGQPEEDDDGWKQMQKQLAEQTNQQQRHIESLHGKLEDQFRAREELQRGQQDLLLQHHEIALQHQQQLAKKERQLLKAKKRAMKQGAKHHDELRRVQSEVDELKKVVEAVQSLDSASPSPSTESSSPPSTPVADAAVNELPDSYKQSGEDAVVTSTEAVVEAVQESVNPLDHIFSAVFGSGPSSFFFSNKQIETNDEARAPRSRRDLATTLKERRERRLAHLASRLNGGRHRRHNQAESGPLLRIDDGQLVPLSPLNTPVVAAVDDPLRRRRHAASEHRWSA